MGLGDTDGPGPWPGPGPGPYPDPCQGVVCPDDGNECTEEYCSGGACGSRPVPNGTPCDFDSSGAGGFGGSGGADGSGGSGGVDHDGVCVNGVCGENLCKDVVCDDDDVCTDDSCDYVDGTCHFRPVVCNDHNRCTEDACDSADGCIFTEVEEGTECSGRFGMCEAGSCVAPCDLASDEEYQCPIIGLEDLFCCPDSQYCRGDCTVPDCQTSEDCDDGNECTRDSCDTSEGTVPRRRVRSTGCLPVHGAGHPRRDCSRWRASPLRMRWFDGRGYEGRNHHR